MPNPDLPIELLINIATRVGKEYWWMLRGLLRSGKKGKEIVYLDSVLKEASIYTLAATPEWINKVDGKYRRFFERCLDAGNVTAIYYEALRFVTQEEDIERGISLLEQIVPTERNATLAIGIFSICVGDDGKGGEYLEMLTNIHGVGLRSNLVRLMGKELMRELSDNGPAGNVKYGSSFKYPDNAMISPPDCAMDCWIEYGEFENLCNDCCLWWCARRVCEML